jgi:hypothetical protein
MRQRNGRDRPSIRNEDRVARGTEKSVTLYRFELGRVSFGLSLLAELFYAHEGEPNDPEKYLHRQLRRIRRGREDRTIDRIDAIARREEVSGERDAIQIAVRRGVDVGVVREVFAGHKLLAVHR